MATKMSHLRGENRDTLRHVSVIIDRYRSIPISISDRPSVSIRPDFRNGEDLEHSCSKSDTNVSDSYRFAPNTQ